jgi:hypothetical protein
MQRVIVASGVEGLDSGNVVAVTERVGACHGRGNDRRNEDETSDDTHDF